MENLKFFLSQAQRILSLPSKVIKKIKYSRSLPRNHVVEDVFLVSYPKSGTTWLRFLIANAIKVHYQIDQEVNFFTLLRIIPPARGNINLRQEGSFGRADLPRIITSHSAYNPYYYRVIWLVRDPRDVMVSYYYYLRALNRISDNISITQFIRHQKYGIKNWEMHTKSWCSNNLGDGQIVKILRYEDFLSDTKFQLSSLMQCFGINMDEKSLEEAIILSSKERMKDLEKRHRSINFMVRQGIASRGQELSEDDKKFIEDHTRDLAQLLGYKF